MSAPAIDRDLAKRLEDLRQEHGEMVRIERVADVVRSLLSTMAGDLAPEDMRLVQELESLADYIHAAHAEIASLRPQDVKEEVIASAADELDAIVAATEKATNEILDAAERIEAVMPLLDQEVAEKLADATTRIYEACNFQDITGQRIGKVVSALQVIEEKVDALVAAFGHVDAGSAKAKPAKAAAGKPSDEDLLNGPQLPADAADQAKIDALFASLD